MKKRRKITEIVVKESAEIHSIHQEKDGTHTLIDSQGNPVSHEQLVGVGYLRDSGKPKILRSIVRRRDDQIGENPWKKYHKIGLVDTNSQVSGDKKLFVCSPSLLMWQDPNGRHGDVYHQDLLVGYCPIQVNPERVGWLDFIRRMQASNLLSSTDRILVVVDSEKALISAINARSEPVFENSLLPDGFTIAYATADSGAESWINKEMKRRDRVASRAMKVIQNDRGFLDLLTRSERLYLKNSFEPET